MSTNDYDRYNEEMRIWNTIVPAVIVFFGAVRVGIAARYNIVYCAGADNVLVQLLAWVLCMSVYFLIYIYIIVPIYYWLVRKMYYWGKIVRSILQLTFLTVTVELAYQTSVYLIISICYLMEY